MTTGRPMELALPTDMSTSRGADLLGWSALPLLADAATEGDWIFALDRSRAWRSSGPLADAHFVEMELPSSGLWPFADDSLHGAVIDGDALGADETGVLRCLGEAARCVGVERNILVVCSERRVPRSLRELRNYRRPGVQVWRSAVAEVAGVPSPPPIAFASFDGDRLTGLRTGQRATASDRLVLRVSSDGVSDSALSSIVNGASTSLGLELGVDRVAVRKIGKTAVFLTGADDNRYILRVARSPIARSRALRGFEALESVRASLLPDRLSALVPRALSRGTWGSYEYFLEACLMGEAGPSRHARRVSGWAVEAADYITRLHQETARATVVDERPWQRLITTPIATIARACADPGTERTLDRLLARCKDGLRGQTIPLVRTHGDFTESNCLFDAEQRLTGVVDWEVSEPAGLPMLDLLQLMPVPGESSERARWLRFDAWLELMKAPESAEADPIWANYVRSMGIRTASIPALVLAQWVTHVAERIEARQDDKRWMEMRVRRPLEALGEALR